MSQKSNYVTKTPTTQQKSNYVTDIQSQSRHPMSVQTPDVSPDIRCQSRHLMSFQTPDVSPDTRCQSRHQMSIQTPDVNPDTRCQSRHPMSVQRPDVNPSPRCQSRYPMSIQVPDVRPEDVPPRPGFRSTLGAGDVLPTFFLGKLRSAITHQMCGVFDPVSFEKNGGASPPVLAVGPDWLDLDFFSRPKIRGPDSDFGAPRQKSEISSNLGALGAP